MVDKHEASVQLPVKDEEPPAYSRYEDEESQARYSPYCPLPSTMNAYYQWSPPKAHTFHLCGASKEERLYLIELHSGRHNHELLGRRPGLSLHNGTSIRDPVLATMGDEYERDDMIYAFKLNTIIQLPPLQPGSRGMTNETMRAAITDDRVAAFRFSLEVGVGEKMTRERFEWRKLPRSESDAKAGGFKLVRLPISSENGREGFSSVFSSAESCEVVATLGWAKGFSSLVQAFSLRLLNSGNEMGERWTLMVLMTALRIWWLHVGGKANKAVISMAEKSHNKSSAPW
ncbi:hypothetical protein AJ79_00140 [Helicocarpus griseus UAMH5409]|uniref:Uncharacterized protein n=1 Tax=Helicocarpus griseus UAMH5409 TaxID=1447875 RepID=A0A2B7YC44_9EURO|nr:hypothetical protein AJ79_00140 [Helicocarpus griseus UAMH5409]